MSVSVEEARRIVEEADMKAAEEEQARVDAAEKPYNELKNSKEFSTVVTKLRELREHYIKIDENKFRKLDTALRLLDRL